VSLKVHVLYDFAFQHVGSMMSSASGTASPTNTPRF